MYLKKLQRCHFDIFDPRMQQRNGWLPLLLWWRNARRKLWTTSWRHEIAFTCVRFTVIKVSSNVAKCKQAMTSLPHKQLLVLSLKLIMLTLWRHGQQMWVHFVLCTSALWSHIWVAFLLSFPSCNRRCDVTVTDVSVTCSDGQSVRPSLARVCVCLC